MYWTRSQTEEMPVNNAARFDDWKSKLDKLLTLQASTNTIVSSLSTRVDSIDHKLGVINGELHTHATQLSAQQKLIDELQKKTFNKHWNTSTHWRTDSVRRILNF